MRKFILLLIFAVTAIFFLRFTVAAENDPQQPSLLPEATEDEQENIGSENQSSQAIDDEEDLILAEVEDVPDQSRNRFIPTEEISQDLGVSFPVDI